MSCPQFGYSNTSSSQLLMSNQATAAAAAAAAASGQTTPQLGSAATGCCESGRPIITDPLTGQSVCSCQYDPQTQLLNYQRLASAGLPLYGTPYTDQSYLPLSAEQSAFYTPTTNGFDLKDNLSAWPYAASVYYPYDTTLAGYPFTNGYGVDLNGARRKNATRETTSTLKAWLNEHKKNPYPTKGEKIMLAIITKMTLTQVSTWFANARRRLKKENKMTWEPRNRVDDEDNTADNADSTDKDGDKLRDGHDRTLDSPPGPTREISVHSLHSRPPGLGLDKESGDDLCVRVGSAEDEDDDDKSISVSIGGHDGLESSKPDGLLMSDSLSSPSSVLSDPASSIHSPLSVESQPQNIATGAASQCTDGVPNKPRIWSIVDTATSNPTPAGSSALYAVAAAGGGGLGLAGGGAGGGGGGHMGLNSGSKLSPLARSLRLDYSTPYPKPTSWFNGSAAAAAAAAAYGAQAPTSAPSDGLLSSFAKPPTLMAAANPYSSLNSALTTSTITASRPCMQTVSSGLNKSLVQSAAGLSRGSPAAPRLHGAFTLNTKLDCQVHQDQRQELQGPAS